MKKRVLLISVLFLFYILVRAAYFEKLPYTITQPDGKTINCFVTGDEYFNWIHDANGYTIIQAPDGYFYYGEQNGDLVQPSKYLVNSIDPASIGLNKWIKISKSEYERKRSAILSLQKGISGPGNAPHSGTMNNLAIYIRFLDQTEFTTTRKVYDDRLNPSTGVALKSYFKEVSYDNLTISSTHYPACALTTNLSYQDSHPRSYFQPYNATTNPNGYTEANMTSREHQLLVDAINWININSPVSPSLIIDGDGDGRVDNVCFIIKGSSGAWDELLWAHRWVLNSQTIYINGKRVYGYTFQPENQVQVTTLCHEMFHALGSPDLYHYDDQSVIYPVWTWDLMEAGSGHMLTYMKWKYSNYTWISSIPEITTTGTYTLNPVTSPTNNCYKIASPYSTDEYFMVEYRNKSGTFESGVPGSGLIVYRIDTRVTGNASGPPDEVYIFRPNGTPSANGTPNDAFFSSTVGRTAINDGTNPNSFLQNGSGGGLNISNVTTAGTTISFNVTFPELCTPPTTQASAFTSSAITNTTMTAGWTRGNGNSVLVVASRGSAVSASPVNGNTYTSNAAFGSGTQLGSGNYVVYSGSGSSVSLVGLSEGSGYYFAVFEYSNTYCYKTPALTGNAMTTGYCVAGSLSTSFEYITNVAIGSINNASGRDNTGYQDFTSLNTTMQIGVNSTVTITVASPYSSDQILIWIDWNKDGDFTDAGENVYSSSGSFASPHTTSNFAPPIGAAIGTTRMRIRLHDTSYPRTANPCGDSDYGEVEDYSINVAAGSVVVPTITTTAVTSISLTTAASGGSITSDGGGAITARGICWATTANPDISNSFTSDGTGTGSFVSNLTVLLPATTYHVRAYATNSIGTGYGADLSFTTCASVNIPSLASTDVSAITLTTGSSGGNITSGGCATINSRGVCWSTSANPTISLSTKTTDGTGTGSFTSTMTGLAPGITYHVRAYATNSTGTGYGNNITFTTCRVVVIPTVTTAALSEITLTNTTSGGFISSGGCAEVTARGVCWDTESNPTIALGTKTTDGTGEGSFTSKITGLTGGTTYHVRAYATNSAGTGYGADISFTCPLSAPVASSATNIVQTSFTANWSNSPSAAGYFLDASTNSAFTTFISSYNGKDVGNVTNTSVTGLTAKTTYYYRVRANGTAGTSPNSNIISTTTLPNVPSAPVVNTATNILQTSFTANWSRSATATGYRLDVATNRGFTSFVPGYNNKDIGNPISSFVTGLTAKTTYYYRLRGYNEGGTSNSSNTITVITLSIPPASPTSLASSSCNNLVTLTWSKSTDPNVTRYRIYAGTISKYLSKIDSTTAGNLEFSKVISGLRNKQTYYFSVTAVNYDGPESPFSTESITTVKTGVIPKIKAKWGDVLICSNLDNSITGFQWYKSSTIISNATNQYYATNKTPGVYNVKITDIDGCVNSSNAISISGTKSLSVYPNPASANFALKLNDVSEGRAVISVLTSAGIKVMEFEVENVNDELLKEIPVNNLDEGIYIVQVLLDNKDLFYTKIIVIK